MSTLHEKFDLSDVLRPVDRLDAVLDVAAEVSAEYGDQPGHTRIERMARYLALNLGGEPYAREGAGSLERYLVRNVEVVRASNVLAMRVAGAMSDKLTPADARAIAIALLRAAERAE